MNACDWDVDEVCGDEVILMWQAGDGTTPRKEDTEEEAYVVGPTIWDVDRPEDWRRYKKDFFS